jgi:hypothetical protein
VRKLLLLPILLLGLAGCGHSDPPVGTIVSLDFIPAHSENVQVDDWTMMCLPSGTSISCYPLYAGSHTETHSYPNAWYARLERCVPNHCDKYRIEISKRQYDTWSIGDWYPTIKRLPGLRRTP